MEPLPPGELEHARIWDMEDLGKAAAEHMGCQFFAMKDLHKEAELILCPYNYIFDVNIRNALEIDLSNAAVVIDEVGGCKLYSADPWLERCLVSNC